MSCNHFRLSRQDTVINSYDDKDKCSQAYCNDYQNDVYIEYVTVLPSNSKYKERVNC